MKLINYPTQRGIHHIISKMTVKPTFTYVPAHIGITLNEKADELAKSAAKEQTRRDINKKHIGPNRLMHHNNTRIECYPPIWMQKRFNYNNNQNMINKIKERNPLFENNQNIDLPTTLEIIAKGTDRISRTDTRYTREKAYHINTILLNNPVLQKIQTFKHNTTVTSTCRRCENEEETQKHILECWTTSEKTEQIIARTIDILQDRIKNKYKNKLTKQEGLPDSPHLMAETINIMTPNFWKTPEARGWITNQFITRVNKLIKDHPTERNNGLKWAKFIMECYNTAIYEIVWKDRNNHTFNTIIESQNIIRKRNIDPEDPLERTCREIKKRKTMERQYVEINNTTRRKRRHDVAFFI
jgi:hypothetical protein